MLYRCTIADPGAVEGLWSVITARWTGPGRRPCHKWGRAADAPAWASPCFETRNAVPKLGLLVVLNVSSIRTPLPAAPPRCWMAALATASVCTTARIAACRSSLRSSAAQRVRARWVVVQVRMMSGGAGGGGSSGGNRAVVWFRGTDLRLHDNVVVHEAARRVQAGQVSEVGARRRAAVRPRRMQQLARTVAMLHAGLAIDKSLDV